MRGRRDTEEVFGPYESYLHSSLWPSIRDGRQELEVVEVEEMAPQYASSAYLKLVRWARREPAGELAVIDDVDMRDEHARSSVLGRHLAARALGLSEEQMHALYGEAGQGGSVDLHHVAAELTVSMGERHPEWDLRNRVSLAGFLAVALDRRFLIKERARDA